MAVNGWGWLFYIDQTVMAGNSEALCCAYESAITLLSNSYLARPILGARVKPSPARDLFQGRCKATVQAMEYRRSTRYSNLGKGY